MVQEDVGRVLHVSAAVETNTTVADLHRELRVSTDEPGDLRVEVRRGTGRLEIPVTPRAVHVIERGEHDATLVLHVAGAAGRLEHLGVVVRRSAVTRGAGLVGDSEEKASAG